MGFGRRWSCFLLAPAFLAILPALSGGSAHACMKPIATSPGKLYNSCVMDFPGSTADVFGRRPDKTFRRPTPPASPFSSGAYARTGTIRLGQ